jgi:hypothetical protein
MVTSVTVEGESRIYSGEHNDTNPGRSRKPRTIIVETGIVT